MHQQSIINDILENLDTEDCIVKVISLVCDKEALTKRLQKDIDDGIRSMDVMDRSIGRIVMYQEVNSIKIETSCKSVDAIAKEIIADNSF